MSIDDLRDLLREEVLAEEPAFTMTSAPPMRQGRNRLRARRLSAGAAGLAVLGIAAAVVPPLLESSTGEGPQLSPASVAALERYDPQKMPSLFDEVVRDTVSVDLPDGEVVARDSQDVQIPEEHFDKASAWHADYAWDDQHLFNVGLFHARGETEGSARKYCEDQLSSGYDLTCTVERLDDGTVVISSTSAVRRGGREADGVRRTWYGVANLTRVDPDRLWFQRQVSARRGGAFLGSAFETVKARTLADAEVEWVVPVEDLQSVAVHPELVFPEPPIDEESGCPWYLPGQGYDLTCGSSEGMAP
jgi:hypothetical protein